MKRLKFDSQGKLVGVDGVWNDEMPENSVSLRTSDSLSFLKDDERLPDDNSGWSLYSEGKKLEPLRFSNGKTQEDIVDETLSLIKDGKKIIFIEGVCGTGKSAIALNIARRIGRTSIIVPIKNLQRQYEEDYTGKKYLIKNGRKLKIAMITGRENHDSIIKRGASCADPMLPDTIKIVEKNYELLKEYYFDNPMINNKMEPSMKSLRRISVAPANPYWSPIFGTEYELPLRDAKKKSYTGLNGKKFIFYHRQKGCSYYDQYQAYVDADVIIFNSAKYLVECALDRKPETEVEIIDEADEFLDNLSSQEELNLTRLKSAMQFVRTDNPHVQEKIDRIIELIQLEDKHIRALGIDEDKIYECRETKIAKIIEILLSSPDLEAELLLDELNYGSSALDIAKRFQGFLNSTYLTYSKREDDLMVNLVTTDLSKKFFDLADKNKVMVLMSGTLHSREVLKTIYGIKDFEVVEAETLQQGNIEVHRTGKEIDCRYSNFASKKYSRKDYLEAFNQSLKKAKKPIVVHVISFEDLPNENEISAYEIEGIMRKESLIEQQRNDKTGKALSSFKAKLTDVLFTTKCSRGVDFPGDMCNSVIFTKYPNPNVNGIFWKVLQKTHKDHYWNFYFDKARREFLQRIYRAVRSKNDHVYVLSPDVRVIDAVRRIQEENKI